MCFRQQWLSKTPMAHCLCLCLSLLIIGICYIERRPAINLSPPLSSSQLGFFNRLPHQNNKTIVDNVCSFSLHNELTPIKLSNLSERIQVQKQPGRPLLGPSMGPPRTGSMCSCRRSTVVELSGSNGKDIHCSTNDATKGLPLNSSQV